MSNEDKDAKYPGQGGMGEAYSKMRKQEELIVDSCKRLREGEKTYTETEHKAEMLAMIQEIEWKLKEGVFGTAE